MAICNSHIGSLQDDSDITIINPSLEHEDHPYVPIITRLKQANPSSENRQTAEHQNLYSSAHEDRHSRLPDGDSTSGFIFVHHDPLEHAKQLEEILHSYIRDLKQESNCQLDCDKRLVTRIMDLIRPAYSNDTEKSKELDKIIENIGVLHDKRHIEQKEKIEHLRMEVNRLTRMMFANNDEQTVQLESSQLNSMFSILPRDASMEQEQWTEIEDDAKKLLVLIESQRDKINTLASLIPKTAPTPPVVQPPSNVVPTPPVVPLDRPEEVTLVTNSKKTSNTPSITALLKKITNMSHSMSQNQTTTNPVTSDTTLINHSPGVSPTQSMNTLTLSTFTPTIVDQGEEFYDQPQPTVEENKPTIDKPHKPIEIPLSQPEPSTVEKPDNTKPILLPEPATVKKPDNTKPILPPEPSTVKKPDITKPLPPREPLPVKKEENVKPVTPPPRPPQPPVRSESPAVEAKKCPVCHFQFSSTIDDLEMYDHIDRCLFPSSNNTPPKDYECPNCKGTFPGYSDKDYLEHLNECYNREF